MWPRSPRISTDGVFHSSFGMDILYVFNGFSDGVICSGVSSGMRSWEFDDGRRQRPWDSPQKQGHGSIGRRNSKQESY